MKKILLLIVLLVFFNSYGQQSKIDSLIDHLNLVKDEIQKINILSNLCDELATNFNSEKDKKYIEQLIALSKKHKNYKSLIKGYQNYSTFFIWTNELEASIKYILKAEKICDSIGDYKSQLDCITQAGAVYGDLKQFNNAQKLFIKGESIINKNIVTKESCTLYVSYANFFMKKEDEQNAIDYYIKSLNCLNDFDDFETKLNCYSGLCWLYIDRKQYKKAEKYALSAIEDSKKIKAEFYKSIFNRILGRVYIDEGQIQKAIKHQLLALNYFIKSNHQLGSFDMLNQLAFSHWKNKDYATSKDYAIKAHVIANKINDSLAINSSNISKAKAYLGLNKISKTENILKKVAKDTINKTRWPTYMKESLLIELFLLYNKKGDYKKALKYNRSLLKLKDSLSLARFNNQVINSETKYQTEKKEKENLQLKTEKAEQALLLEKETKQKWLLGIGFISLLLILVIGGYFYQKNKKQKEVIETLQKDLHHRVKNNLAIINRFIDVVKEEFNNEAFDAKLIELQNRIASINEVHQQLYNNKDATKLGVKKYIEKLKQNIENTYVNKNITVEQHIDTTVNLKADISFPIGLIVNEFLTNSFKYAFTNTEKGKISININEADNHYKLELADNGKGFPKGFDISNSKTFGLRIMKLLTQQINGTFKIDGANGVKLTIQFPK